jgi:hypothetical protein
MPKIKTRPPAHTKRLRTQREPRFSSHVRAHEEITSDELWYSDQPPDLGSGFSAAKAQGRTSTVLGILLRAAKRAEKTGTSDLAEAYYQLHDKLDACRPPSRCGSLACPRCARAFQKAKIAAQQGAITQASQAKSGRHLVFVTVVPKAMMYSPGGFHEIDIKKANRWLKDTMKKVGNRTMLGSGDLGWETRRSGKYIQVHWHLAMWTSSKKKLKVKLAKGFLRRKKHEKPVQVKMAYSHGFLGYMNKAIKLPHLLRTNRKHLPELLLVLDRTEPMDLMIYTQHRLTAQFGRLAFKPIGRGEW